MLVAGGCSRAGRGAGREEREQQRNGGNQNRYRWDAGARTSPAGSRGGEGL